ncbi:beta-1,3-glucan-binding protein-like isoform X1 [Vanessa atalanta]|uniref:beta-1,3-glucan-binding protein-like isoform X1 n=2 Tax=Vanessa atalanta TaxID=42275 RepID=UPI001FCD0BC7|nr:beta-1,3-glucan-binding protein-like isoform X1 [Vanessa atalanta]
MNKQRLKMNNVRKAIVFIVLILQEIYTQNETDYVIPEITIQALKPKGFRAFIPGDPRINLLHIEANFYDSLQYVGGVREFVTTETNGRWMYEDRVSQLKVGTVVVYYVFVALRRGELDYSNQFLAYAVNGYATGGKQHKITELQDPDDYSAPSTVQSECRPTVTRIHGGAACAGQTIFEDDFDVLREDLWQIDQYIPKDHPEHPFISYQKLPSDSVLKVENGTLKIQPILQQDLPGFTNNSLFSKVLDLQDECTGSVCITKGTGLEILPPVVSGRLSSKFSFTYGIVEIRAKMPIGDWLYPELFLESLTKKYGSTNYASGVLKIATVFGNKQLNEPLYTNKFLRGIALTNAVCKPVRDDTKEYINGTWSDDFHVFSVKWTPSSIELSVDGQIWSRVRPGKYGLRSWMPIYCRDKWLKLLNGGGKMAPFDHYFYLSLGLSVGGTEFPDSLKTSDGRPKPWINLHRKATLNFWKDESNWHPTWTQPLLIDYVKIKAL